MKSRTNHRTHSAASPSGTTQDPLAPWNVSESEYPFSGETWEKLSFCLNYAVLAPSGHNTQPWRFKLGLDEVKLYADRTRALPMVDPHDRELIMSCAAALFHLRLAIRYFGHADEVFLFPDAIDRDLLVQIQLGKPRALKADEHATFRAITPRRTNRQPFEPRPVSERVLTSLKQAAADEDAGLMVVGDKKARHQTAQLVWQADRAQMNSPSFRRELAAWIQNSVKRTF